MYIHKCLQGVRIKNKLTFDPLELKEDIIFTLFCAMMELLSLPFKI